MEIQDRRLENIARFALKEALGAGRKPILVEDSGLFIEALGGFPGPYSSFVYATIGLKGILDLLRKEQHRQAYFQSTIAFRSPSVEPRVFTGRVSGRIARRALGTSGFGYDPIFIPSGSEKTFGQTELSLKNVNSHRAMAFRRFARWFATSSSNTVRKSDGKRALK